MDDMPTFMDVMNDIFHEVPRQGPGSIQTTQRALSLCPSLPIDATIVDIGCGTGIQTRTLAQALPDQTIWAFDLSSAFVQELQHIAKGYRMMPLRADMKHLPFALGSIDLMWAEGSAYSIGFENALRTWHDYLKLDGCLAVSELVWLKSDAPEDLRQFWAEEYPDMRHVDALPSLFASCGYRVVDQFNLPATDWQAYYAPLEAKLPALRDKYQSNEMAQMVLDGMTTEIEMCHQYSEYYSYAFVIAQRA
jgi:SAM-dependent methyltransferase